MSDAPKDGFDLIEYPCEYNFKAMCLSEGEVSASDYIRGLVLPMVNDGAIRSVTSRRSKTGKYEAVTVAVTLQSRDELESIYALISASERVVMTL